MTDGRLARSECEPTPPTRTRCPLSKPCEQHFHCPKTADSRAPPSVYRRRGHGCRACKAGGDRPPDSAGAGEIASFVFSGLASGACGPFAENDKPERRRNRLARWVF